MFKRKPKEDSNAHLLKQLFETEQEMVHFRNQFNITTDDLLCDYFIYRLKASEAKHQYFIKLLNHQSDS